MPAPVRRQQRARLQVGADADQVVVRVGRGSPKLPAERGRLDGHERYATAHSSYHGRDQPGGRRQVGKQLAPKISEIAPGLTTTFVREALHRAIVGVGPLPPAAKAADAQLSEQKGNVEQARCTR